MITKRDLNDPDARTAAEAAEEAARVVEEARAADEESRWMLAGAQLRLANPERYRELVATLGAAVSA